MIVNTHRLVGEFLYNQLSPSYQEFIHKRRFVYGNVKPDIVKEYRQMSHYHRDNAELIFKMLDRLLTEETTIEQFSENLGILIHFFCDYTCIYHANDHLYENHSILKHMKYEVMLHRYAAKKFLTLETVRMIPFKSVDEIKGYVCDLTSRLNQVPLTRSVAQDFDDMMLLSVSVLQYIINQYEFHKLLISHDKR
ncbi:MAG: zinc dependent phospholipase C family protein [Turicibacter sp.]|nr:zinc dependent phospholipase C family protein [Turicibacter sp.]